MTFSLKGIFFLILFLILSSLLFISCAAINMLGTWEGTRTQTYPTTQTQSMVVSITNDANGSISGTVTTGGYVLDFDGTRNGANFSGVATQGSYMVNIDGSIDGDNASGTWTDNASPQCGGNFSLEKK